MLPNRTSLPPYEVQWEMCTARPFKTSLTFRSSKTASLAIKHWKIKSGRTGEESPGKYGRWRVREEGQELGILKWLEAGEIEREIIRNNPLNILVAIENG